MSGLRSGQADGVHYRGQSSAAVDFEDATVDEEEAPKPLAAERAAAEELLVSEEPLVAIDSIPQRGMAGIHPGDDDVAPFDGTSELAMWCDESDLQLDADLILRLCQPRGVDRLSKVKQLR